MLKRIRIRGYKSFDDLEARLGPLAVLFGPNASGKSNFLDALQLLSRLAASRTVAEAFDPPHRGAPLESFAFREGGLKGALARERLTLAIEADLSLSDAVVETVNREIREHPEASILAPMDNGGKSSWERDRYLRYRIEVEMTPKSGILRVSDEYLAALNRDGKPAGNRRPFIEVHKGTVFLRGRRRDRSIPYRSVPYGYMPERSRLSLGLSPPHLPHVVAVRRELESWRFFYFEPRERMRDADPIKETTRIGPAGQNLAGFLRTLKTSEPERFQSVERSLPLLIPGVEGIELEPNDRAEVELRLRVNGVPIPARLLSDGTLRMLGLLALSAGPDAPALIGLEEPENGVHPRRIELVAEYLRTRSILRKTQYVVTTHSPIMPNTLPKDSLFPVTKPGRRTRIDPFSDWGPAGRRRDTDPAFDGDDDPLPISERILRGDFGD